MKKKQKEKEDRKKQKKKKEKKETLARGSASFVIILRRVYRMQIHMQIQFLQPS